MKHNKNLIFLHFFVIFERFLIKNGENLAKFQVGEFYVKI